MTILQGLPPFHLSPAKRDNGGDFLTRGGDADARGSLNHESVLRARFPPTCRGMLFRRYSASVDKRRGCKWIWQPFRGNAQYLRRRSIGRQEQVRPVENKSSGRQTDVGVIRGGRGTSASDEQATGWPAADEMAPRVPRRFPVRISIPRGSPSVARPYSIAVSFESPDNPFLVFSQASVLFSLFFFFSFFFSLWRTGCKLRGHLGRARKEEEGNGGNYRD